MNTPIHTFTSHVQGKNATVNIYQDRIEWERPRGLLRIGNTGAEMIPVRSISSIRTERDGFINTKVQVVTTGNTIDFRVSHAAAKEVADIIRRLMLES
jgi:hypothetical protein